MNAWHGSLLGRDQRACACASQAMGMCGARWCPEILLGTNFNCLVNWVIKQNCCAEKRTVVSAVGLLKRKRVRSVLPASQIIAVGPADKGARSVQKVALQVEHE